MSCSLSVTISSVNSYNYELVISLVGKIEESLLNKKYVDFTVISMGRQSHFMAK